LYKNEFIQTMQDRKKPDVQIKIELETRVKNKDERHPVKLRVYYNRKYRYYTLKGQHYSEDEFFIIQDRDTKQKYLNLEKGKRIRISDVRKRLDAAQARALDIIDNVLQDFTFESFETEFKGHKKKESTVQAYFDNKVAELEKTNKYQTAAVYRAAKLSLEAFDPRITFHKITPQYLKKYEAWMIKQGKQYTTIGIYLRHFKAIINQAQRDRIIKDYPFGNSKDKYQIPASRNIKKALTIQDIEKLFSYQPENDREKIALQYFLFSYLANGMNLADIAALKYADLKANNFEFYRQKTKDTSKRKTKINVLLIPQLKDIIQSLGNQDKEPDNYIFPIYKKQFSESEKYYRLKVFTKFINDTLKKIAPKIGINEAISTYWARHTYSTILKRTGAPIEFIAEQLGHQSTRVTVNYLDSFEDEQREKFTQNLLPESMKQKAK